jgi:hypothetical protein
MRRSLWLIGLLMAACGLEAAPQAAARDIPFKFVDGLIWIKVHGTHTGRSLNFLLDSGASVSVLNLRTAKELGMKLARPVTVQGVRSTTTGYWPQRIALAAQNIPLPSSYAAVDLDDLSNSCHCTIDGLLGADFFRGRIVQIDFGERKIRLLTASSTANADQVLPLKSSRGVFLAPVVVNQGERQWMRVDTGCASPLQWVTRGSGRHQSTNRIAVALAEVSLDVISAEVQIGATQFERVPTEIHNKPIFPGESGLLGNGLLAQFDSLTLDSKAGRMLLQKRNGFGADEPWPTLDCADGE